MAKSNESSSSESAGSIHSAGRPGRPDWTSDQIPSLSGKNVVITGANSGIGFEAATVLARKGAHVVLGCRSAEKAEAAIVRMRESAPGEELDVEARILDLASLASIRAFADKILADFGQLHLLINNAGVMAIPKRCTEDGFEMQLGTNHLGHFALTGRLIERLLASEASRVVNVSSTMHSFGWIHWDDLQLARRYNAWIAYGQSKLANLLFSYELQRRLAGAASSAISVACHPGYAATNLQHVGPQMAESTFMDRLWTAGNALLSQTAEQGAWPTLFAATSPDAKGGDYFGPSRMFGMHGPPVKVTSNKASYREGDAARFWEVSEELTDVRFDALAERLPEQPQRSG